MENRLRLANKLLKEANERILLLEKERDANAQLVETLRSVVASSLAQQKFDANNLRRTFAHFGQQYADLIKDLSASFKTFTERCADDMKQEKYHQKVLRDQISVKRMKYAELSKKCDTLSQRLNNKDEEMKNLSKQWEDKEEELKNQTVLKCMRCKARKAVISKLEQEIIVKTKEMQTMQETSAKSAAELARLKESCQMQKREIFELKTKLKDEIDKNTARSNDPCLYAELSRTPAGSSEDSASNGISPQFADFPYPLQPAQLNVRAEKDVLIQRLQWLVTNKSNELADCQKSLQQLQVENQMTVEELLRYEHRCEQLNIVQDELEVKTCDVQNLSAKVSALESQLDSFARQNDCLKGALEESRRENDVIQSLLTNLAASVRQTIM